MGASLAALAIQVQRRPPALTNATRSTRVQQALSTRHSSRFPPQSNSVSASQVRLLSYLLLSLLMCWSTECLRCVCVCCFKVINLQYLC